MNVSSACISMNRPTYALVVGSIAISGYRWLYLSFSREPDRRLCASDQMMVCSRRMRQILRLWARLEALWASGFGGRARLRAVHLVMQVKAVRLVAGTAGRGRAWAARPGASLTRYEPD